ncbi:hypothetical protein K3V35_14720, partial [Listeria monocytogenes]|nr:hypothetical protein [Listeria monocytogenes]
RARIEAAEQGGERSAEEIDEARAALGQLEMLRDKLQRESPQLLPGDSAPTSPAAPGASACVVQAAAFVGLPAQRFADLRAGVAQYQA